jgi:hypothetical protein
MSLTTLLVPSVAPLGAVSVTLSRSLPSNTLSFVIETVIVFVVSPGAKFSVPVAAV